MTISPHAKAAIKLSKYADQIGKDHKDHDDFKWHSTLLASANPKDHEKSAHEMKELESAGRDVVMDHVWKHSSREHAQAYYKAAGMKRLREDTLDEASTLHGGQMTPNKIHAQYVDGLVKSGQYKYHQMDSQPGYPADILIDKKSGKKVRVSTGDRDATSFKHKHSDVNESVSPSMAGYIATIAAGSNYRTESQVQTSIPTGPVTPSVVATIATTVIDESEAAEKTVRHGHHTITARPAVNKMPEGPAVRLVGHEDRMKSIGVQADGQAFADGRGSATHVTVTNNNDKSTSRFHVYHHGMSGGAPNLSIRAVGKHGVVTRVHGHHEVLKSYLQGKSIDESLEEMTAFLAEQWGNFEVETSTGKHVVYGPNDKDAMTTHLHGQMGGAGKKHYGDVKTIAPYTGKVAPGADPKSHRSYNEETDVDLSTEVVEAVGYVKPGSHLKAGDAYAEHMKHNHDLLKGIHTALKSHQQRNTKDAHWGHVGDAAHVHKQLQSLHDMLTGGGEYSKARNESVDEPNLEEAMISFSDFRDKMAAHRKAGNKVVDDKYSDNKATYTTIGPDGTAHKITHLPTGTKAENLGSVKDEDDQADTTVNQLVKRGRGRPVGSKSGARRHK